MRGVFVIAIFAAAACLSFACKCPAVDSDDVVYFENEEFCNKFYQCSNGRAFDFTCASGTFWNQTLTACSFEVDCEGKQIFITTTTITTSTTTATTPTVDIPIENNYYS